MKPKLRDLEQEKALAGRGSVYLFRLDSSGEVVRVTARNSYHALEVLKSEGESGALVEIENIPRFP